MVIISAHLHQDWLQSEGLGREVLSRSKQKSEGSTSNWRSIFQPQREGIMLLKSSSLLFFPLNMISIIFCFQASLPWTSLTRCLVAKRKVRDSYADFGTFLLSPVVKMH